MNFADTSIFSCPRRSTWDRNGGVELNRYRANWPDENPITPPTLVSQGCPLSDELGSGSSPAFKVSPHGDGFCKARNADHEVATESVATIRASQESLLGYSAPQVPVPKPVSW